MTTSTRGTTARKIRPADDAPFDFNLDSVAAEADSEPFRVHFGGRRWEMAHMEDLDIWQLTAKAAEGELGNIVAVFQAALGDQFAEFKKLSMTARMANKLFDAYAQHCGVDPGELPGSTAS